MKASEGAYTVLSGCCEAGFNQLGFMFQMLGPVQLLALLSVSSASVAVESTSRRVIQIYRSRKSQNSFASMRVAGKPFFFAVQ